MIFNVIDWESDEKNDLYRKIHPTQKPVKLIEKLIEIFTDVGDVVIDPVAGSGSSLVAAINKDRKAYGFEIKRDFHKQASDWMDFTERCKKEIKAFGFSESLSKAKDPLQEVLFQTSGGIA